jgi:ring-1,2-phenylacetyl-CoA epoxidase subunit PaaC
LRHSADWVLRLGDGTAESKKRMQAALDELWLYVEDMFDADEVDEMLLKEGIAADMKAVKALWEKSVNELLTRSGLVIPPTINHLRKGSRKGNHTENLGYILAEMQFLPRAYPDAIW